ncbi:MAG: hypothetical protein SFV53_01095 [Rickettsiales bacterium]|nr:hypothetical protein [Rickettsiales bacterium]
MIRLLQNLNKNRIIFLERIFFCLILFFISSQSFGATNRTKGNYLEIDAVGFLSHNDPLVAQDFIDENTSLDSSSYYIEGNSLKASGPGYGLSYKYAYSFHKKLIHPFDRIFIAPGLFYENLKANGEDKVFGDKLSFNKRYGAKLDIGFDFDYNLGVYFTNGISALNYTVDWMNCLYVQNVGVSCPTDNSAIFGTTKISGRSYAYFYGIGATYHFFKNFALILEYSMQSNTLKASTSAGYKQSGVIFDRIKSESQILKFGLAYRF